MSEKTERPTCKKCDTPLTGRIRRHFTICPNCGKRWRLNEDNTAIYTTVLEVQSVEHKHRNVFIDLGGKKNG